MNGILTVLTAFGIFLRDHVWKSYRSTILGLGVAIVTDVLLQLKVSPNPMWHTIAGLVWVPFLAWKDKAVQSGEIISTPAPSDRSTEVKLGIIFFLALSLTSCAMVKSLFGPTLAADEIACAKAIPAQLAAAVTVCLAGLDSPQCLATLESDGIQDIICAVAALRRDLTVCQPSTAAVTVTCAAAPALAANAKAYLEVKKLKPVLP